MPTTLATRGRPGVDQFTGQLARVRPVTRHLVESALTDRWPNDDALIAFGIDSRRNWEALSGPIRTIGLAPAAPVPLPPVR